MRRLHTLTPTKAYPSVQRVVLARREATTRHCVDRGHVSSDRGHSLRLSLSLALYCFTSPVHLIYPMGSLPADSFVEAVAYICDHVQQHFGVKILQFQGGCLSSFMDGGVIINARRVLGFSISLFPPYVHWRSIIENYIRHIRDQAIRKMPIIQGIKVRCLGPTWGLNSIRISSYIVITEPELVFEHQPVASLERDPTRTTRRDSSAESADVRL